METISDSPTGSTELFATCQLGNHLLTARGDRAVCGTQGEGGTAVTPGSSRGIQPLWTTLSSAPKGAPVPKTSKIPVDLSLGCLDYLFLFVACLFVWERGAVLFLASFPKKKSGLFFLSCRAVCMSASLSL